MEYDIEMHGAQYQQKVHHIVICISIFALFISPPRFNCCS